MDNRNRDNMSAWFLVFQNLAAFLSFSFPSLVCPFGTRLENHVSTHDPPTCRWVSGDSGLFVVFNVLKEPKKDDTRVTL